MATTKDSTPTPDPNWETADADEISSWLGEKVDANERARRVEMATAQEQNRGGGPRQDVMDAISSAGGAG